MITFPDASFLSPLEAREATEGGSEQWEDIFLSDMFYGLQIYVSGDIVLRRIQNLFIFTYISEWCETDKRFSRQKLLLP